MPTTTLNAMDAHKEQDHYMPKRSSANKNASLSLSLLLQLLTENAMVAQVRQT